MKNIHEQLTEQSNIVKALNSKLQEELEILDTLFYEAMKQNIEPSLIITIEKNTTFGLQDLVIAKEQVPSKNITEELLNLEQLCLSLITEVDDRDRYYCDTPAGTIEAIVRNLVNKINTNKKSKDY